MTTCDPISKHCLSTCRHISPVIAINRNDYPNVLSLLLDNYTIKLAADSEEIMQDWTETLKTKLASLEILQSSANIYSDSPSNQLFLNHRPVSSSSFDINDELYEPIFGGIPNLVNGMHQVTLATSLIPDGEAPPPYESICSVNSSRTSVFSFRESQVEKLKNDMNSPGLRLNVSVEFCLQSLTVPILF